MAEVCTMELVSVWRALAFQAPNLPSVRWPEVNVENKRLQVVPAGGQCQTAKPITEAIENISRQHDQARKKYSHSHSSTTY